MLFEILSSIPLRTLMHEDKFSLVKDGDTITLTTKEGELSMRLNYVPNDPRPRLDRVRKSYGPELIEEIKTLLDQGLTQQEVAARTGVSQSYVSIAKRSK